MRSVAYFADVESTVAMSKTTARIPIYVENSGQHDISTVKNEPNEPSFGQEGLVLKPLDRESRWSSVA